MLRVVLASALAGASQNFFSNGFIPLSPFLVPPEYVGVVLSLQGGAACLTLPVIGPIVDSMGSEVVLLRGILMQAVSIILTVLCSSLTFQALGRIIQGCASSMLFNASIAYVMEHFQEPDRAKHVGTVLGAVMVGGMLGTPIISSSFGAAQRWSLPCPKAWAFIPWMGLLVVADFMIRSVPCSSRPCKPSGTDLTTSPQGGLCQKFCGVYLAVGRQAFLLAALLLCVFGASGALQCAGVLELHSKDVSAATIGAVFVPNMLVQAFASPWAGSVANTPTRRWGLLVGGMFALASGLACVGFLALDNCSVIALVLLAMLVVAIGVSLVDAPSISLMTEFASARGCGNGEAVTASEMAVTAGAAIGPVFGQWLLPRAGFGNICWVLGASSLVLGLLASATLEQAGNTRADNERGADRTALLSS